jgi:glucose-1-phosphatase
MKHKLFIFDMGGVVVQNFDVFPKIFQTLNISENKFDEYSGNNFLQLLEGKISSEQFWGSFSKNYGSPIKQDLFKEFFQPTTDLEVVGLITELKHSARVVCGTNVIDPHYDYLLEHQNYDLFDLVYASHKMGIAKPDQNFYRYILGQENIDAAESCFIDDTRENVDAAAQLGMKAIHFTGAASLKAIL